MSADSADAQRIAQDEAAREGALDAGRSWLVQAPAGSGKTELLVQRMLVLLAHAREPERVVAVTFTDKAAREMRARVLRALGDAAAQSAADTPHRARTLATARAVLARDAQEGWHLLASPSRLAISTLDALAARIAAQAPVASQFGRKPAVLPDARPLYRQAARDALAAAAGDDPSWQTLLLHFDNNANRVVELVAGLLARRDQWLPTLAGVDPDAARVHLEATLAEEVAEVLADLAQRVASTVSTSADDVADTGSDDRTDLVAEWRALLAYAAQTLATAPEAVPDATLLREAAEADDLLAGDAVALPRWRALARWLLTDKGVVRATLKVTQGIPAAGSGAGKAERATWKARADAWLARVRAVPALAEALAFARNLPDPVYSGESRALIDALLRLLPGVIAAQLRVTFAATGQCDFPEVTLRALEALGTEDAPSDVLLAHDLAIDHLLVDEFQDTSRLQWLLLTRLTAGWVAGDGRTIFAVGDPMQSIYGFREADVDIFVESARQGIVAGVPVEVAQLARNFRSQARLVAAVNDAFPRVMADVHRLRSPDVPFAAAAPARDARDDDVTFECAQDADDEARIVVGRVRAALAADDTGDVAILVRARRHLEAIHDALRRAGIAGEAVRIESLAERPVTMDLASLVRALTQPADRHAWLCVLRAPWCGLRLPDLLRMADAGAERATPIGELLRAGAALPALSDDGDRRIRRLRAALDDVLHMPQQALVERVRAAWNALGGPLAYGSDAAGQGVDEIASEAFFTLLAAHARGGSLDDHDLFADAVADLRADPPGGGARVRLMTLHAAKGLEFDTVILPGLAARPRGTEMPLMRWRQRDGRLLMATPRESLADDHDPIDRYLRDAHGRDEAAELVRLLYVAFTRARERLHLVGTLRSEPGGEGGARRWRRAARGTALSTLWPALQARLPAVPEGDDPVADATAPPDIPPQPLRRLPAGFEPLAGVTTEPLLVAPGERASETDPVAAPVYDWALAGAAAIGTAVHRVLAEIGSEGLAAWSSARIDRLAPRIDADLAMAGLDDEARRTGIARVQDALRRTLADGRGRWLFAPSHADAASEYAVTFVDGGEVRHWVIDRTFVDGDTRWIVDFKTGAHEGGGRDAFLASERERHMPQLQRYARAMAALDPRPLRLALYYPLLGALVEITDTPR
ncbi:MAG: UvrD-helicase domain-containing protein [Proteobacteria bacterium]|nr:UvrD-helicase domain-containing protein [Pseudomonadota bacterium]